VTLEALIREAAAGDQAAWEAIVSRFERLIWATVRSHRLSDADAADVAQTTWLRLVENLDRIREPERLAGWLATTARRESLRRLRLNGRELPTEAEQLDTPEDGEAELRLLTDERDAGLWRAFARLSDKCRQLLRLLVALDEPSYEVIGAALGMPIGSIGPTRMRCVETLRTLVSMDPAFQGEVA
jgi:RNA polymerase sigma factor (sigma-70 family)